MEYGTVRLANEEICKPLVKIVRKVVKFSKFLKQRLMPYSIKWL